MCRVNEHRSSGYFDRTQKPPLKAHGGLLAPWDRWRPGSDGCCVVEASSGQSRPVSSPRPAVFFQNHPVSAFFLAGRFGELVEINSHKHIGFGHVFQAEVQMRGRALNLKETWLWETCQYVTTGCILHFAQAANNACLVVGRCALKHASNSRRGSSKIGTCTSAKRCRVGTASPK